MYKYIYICENSKHKKYYCGKHETESLSDGYAGSASGSEYITDMANGLIKAPKKIFFHDDSQVILACEHFLILSLKNASWKLYNNNTGGGGKGKIDLALVPDLFREIVECIIQTSIIKDINLATNENAIGTRVHQNFLSGKYDRVFESMDVIRSYEVHQPRAKLLDAKHVAKHEAEMKRDLSDYFDKTNPLVIVDDDRNGKMYKVEGNHRFAAANNLDLQKFPITHIPFSHFEYNWIAVTKFCNKLNKPKEIKQDLTPEDLRMQMAQLSNQKPDLDIDSDAFETEVYGTFSEEYSAKELEVNLRLFREKVLEQKKKSERNFFEPSKHDLAETQKEILIDKDFKDACVISVASNAIMNSGIGAILHKLSENKNKKQGIIVTRHTDTKHEDSQQNYIDHFVGTLAEAGFVSTNSNLVFTNPHSNKKIKLVILPCRVESTKVGMRYWNCYKEAIDAIR